MDIEKLVNLTALSEVFISGCKDDLSDVDKFYIVIEKKDDTFIEIEINKEDLSSNLVDIFSKDVFGMKNVNIYYYKNKIKKFLNGISIF